MKRLERLTDAHDRGATEVPAFALSKITHGHNFDPARHHIPADWPAAEFGDWKRLSCQSFGELVPFASSRTVAAAIVLGPPRRRPRQVAEAGPPPGGGGAEAVRATGARESPSGPCPGIHVWLLVNELKVAREVPCEGGGSKDEEAPMESASICAHFSVNMAKDAASWV